jgi:trans-2,3-dihydro-3-hydroxyanthranilate isomerase
MRRLPFVQLDVFTRTPLQGNQLAVFTDATGLSDEEMQRIAKETNLSETTFIFPRDRETEARQGVRVRIFTVEEELPFAGHPTLGTATVIRGYMGGGEKVDLHLNVGKIPVTFRDENSGPAFSEMRQNDPTFTETHSARDIAEIARISPDGIRTDLPIQTVSTGNPFIIVPLKSIRAIELLELNHRAARAYLEKTSAHFIYFLTTETSSPDAQIHARMIFYNGEDPATGSAAGPAIAYLVEHGVIASEQRVIIEQGLEMGRPSQLYVRAKKENGRVIDVHVGGYAVEIARGEYRLP